MRVLLYAADSPHMVDRFFDTMTESTGFIVTIHHNHHLLGIHHSANTYSQSCLGNQVDIIIEETAIGNYGQS